MKESRFFALILVSVGLFQRVWASTMVGGESTQSFRIFKRPPVPLGNGTVYNTTAPITTRPENTGPPRLSTDLAVYGNTTFTSLCSSSDRACYRSCTSIMASCQASYSAWSDSSLSYVRSVASRMGNGTTTVQTTYHYTQTQSASTVSMFSITELFSLTTGDFGIEPTGTRTVVLENAGCDSGSCEGGRRSTTTVSDFLTLCVQVRGGC